MSAQRPSVPYLCFVSILLRSFFAGSSIYLMTALECMLQAQACLKLLPSSPSAASELAFIQCCERLKDYDITMSPLQCLQV